MKLENSKGTRDFGPEEKIVREEVEYGVGHYGDYIIYNDELDLYDLDNIQSSFLDVLGEKDINYIVFYRCFYFTHNSWSMYTNLY